MSCHSRIQPINEKVVVEDPSYPQAMSQALGRLLERPFNLYDGGDSSRDKPEEFDPSSACLENMVRQYIENPEKQSKCIARNYCTCFIGGGTNSEEEESSDGDLRKVKNLVCCVNISEKNIASKAKEIVEKADPHLKTLVDELIALGYDAAICKSKWKYSTRTLCPAGKYEYLDVLIGGERVLIDINFKSNFEIARPTETYKSICQTLPCIFVGQVDRLKKIVVVVSKAAKESLKKSGLHVSPWRKSRYILTKWVSPYVRCKGET